MNDTQGDAVEGTPAPELVNPYIAGAPVTEARMFFGREDVFDWIKNSLAGQYAEHILVVHGQRRVGKTSVLKQLGNRLPDRYIPVFFDLQGRTHTTLDRFLWWLAREIVRVLKQDREIDFPLPDKDAFTSDLEYFEHRFLTDLQPVLGSRVLLLTFDEFDNLEEDEVKEELAGQLIDYLRRLMGNDRLNFIFSIGSSGRKLENMQASYTEFFKTALYKKISFLNEEQTRNLVIRPVEGLIKYERGTAERIYEIASGHPYFTQLTCHELFARCQRTGRRSLAIPDIEAVLDDVVERGTVNLKFVWDEASDIEKWGLAALAQIDGKASQREVAEFLRGQKVRFVDSDLTSGLLHLKEKDVLTSDGRFVIQLMTRWLQKNRPLEQVREELTEVNPIANRYIEIGMEFKETRQFEKAIESFQQALAVAPGNVQAQVNVGLTYMDQKACDKAVVEFEKALAIDDEDVSARAGLCDAHLALGDAAMARNRSREAVQSYQRVLAINAEHTEARGRMAEIASQRAEKSLADGKDEEALAAFSEALKYTPEDPALLKRVEAVRAEKKAKVLESLIARSEKETGARNWAAAIASLEEAGRLAPDDASLGKRLEDVRQMQRKAELATILAKADQAAKASRWDDVAAALTEYLAQEPGDVKVQKRLAEVREAARESLLASLKAKARSLAKAEKHEQALAAWEEYLAFDPGDKKKVAAEIEGVKKARSQAEAYAEAQKALTKKNYDRAIGLLKDIVVENADYRDASRLMSQAVELRRTSRKWWQSRWLWGGLGGLALLALGWLLFRSGPQWMASVFPTRTGMLAPTGTPLPPTPTATPAPTAIPLTWARLNSGQFLPRDTVSEILIDPDDPGVIYVATGYSGIYKSIDGGLSWQPAYRGLDRVFLLWLRMDPNDSRVLYTGSYGQIFKSTDGAQTWQALAGPEGHSLNSLLIDPASSQQLLLSGDSEMYESDDGGDSWRPLRGSDTGSCPDSFNRAEFDPAQTGVILAGQGSDSDTCPAGLYRSSDGGQTWTMVLQDFDSSGPYTRLAFGVDADGDHYALAAGMSRTTGEQATFASQDGGQTWILLDDHYAAVAPRPDGSVIGLGEYGGNSINVSVDGGESWIRKGEVPGFNTMTEQIAIAVSPLNPEVIFVGGNGLFVSTDGGASWSTRTSGLPAGHLELQVDPIDPATLYVWWIRLWDQVSSTLYRSSDSGHTWESITDCGFGLAFDPSGQVLYRGNYDVLCQSTDRGQQWQTGDAIPDIMMAGLAVQPGPPGRLFVMNARDLPGPIVAVSEDSGITWEPAGGDFSTAMLFAPVIHFGRSSAQIAYLSTQVGNAYHTDDGGLTWTPCGDLEDLHRFGNSHERIAVHPGDSNTLFAATASGGVMLSRDGCASWQPINTGLGSLFVNAIAIDPNDPDTLYAGTDGGAYLSYNAGQSWGPINDGLLGATVVYSILVDGQSNVYAATPYGIFMLEGR